MAVKMSCRYQQDSVEQLQGSTMTSRVLIWLWRQRYTFAVGCVLLFAIILRVALVLAGWPGTDSDDSTMGLMARHILFQREHPIFFWGQAYMGSLEAYIGALFFALFGSSPATLKLSLIFLYALFLVVMFLLLKMLFDQRWALIGLVILSLGSPAVLYLLLNAYGGYLETLLFGALLILLTCYLLRIGGKSTRAQQFVVFGAWGLVAGFGIYSDPLIAPFVVCSAFAIITLLRCELLRKAGLLLCLGFLFGISPWIIYVTSAESPDAAKSFLQHQPSPQQTAIPGTSGSPSPSLLDIVETHVLGTVVIAIPNMTSGMNLCRLAQDDAWPPDRWGDHYVQPCIAIRSVWGVGVLTLMLLSIIWESAALRGLLRGSPQEWTGVERLQVLRAVGRLLAVLAPLLTVVLFALSSASATSPWIYARYLVTLLIAIPVILASVGERIARYLPRPGRVARTGSVAALILVISMQIPGTLAAFRQVKGQQIVNAQQMDLVQQLIAHHDLAIYTEFWTCYRTAFLSDERITCSVIAGNYIQKPNRYPPYDTTVQAVKPPTFVFPLGASLARNFPALAHQQGWRYNTIIVDDQWVIYEVLESR